MGGDGLDVEVKDECGAVWMSVDECEIQGCTIGRSCARSRIKQYLSHWIAGFHGGVCVARERRADINSHREVGHDKLFQMLIDLRGCITVSIDVSAVVEWAPLHAWVVEDGRQDAQDAHTRPPKRVPTPLLRDTTEAFRSHATHL
jgi:hypothetical protein